MVKIYINNIKIKTILEFIILKVITLLNGIQISTYKIYLF